VDRVGILEVVVSQGEMLVKGGDDDVDDCVQNCQGSAGGKVSGLDEGGKCSRDSVSDEGLSMADTHDYEVVENIAGAVRQCLPASSTPCHSRQNSLSCQTLLREGPPPREA
jgi:hypothetical protein